MSYFGSIRNFIANYLVKYAPLCNFPSLKIKFLSIFYNIFLSFLPFIVSILPIIFSTINNNIMPKNQLGIFLLINLITFILIFIDWIMFISTSDLYYQTKKRKDIVVKLLFNFPRTFQLLSSLFNFIIYAIFITSSSSYIFMIKNNIDQNLLQIIIFIALFFNVLTFFPRLFVNIFNKRKLSILKTLFFKRIYALFYCFFALIIFTFVFSYIVFLTQVDTPLTDSIGNPIEWTYWKSLWYCFVTITTIGYGDIVVTTALGKVFSIPLAIIGIITYSSISALFISIINDYNTIKDELRRSAKTLREKHADHDLLLKEINKIMLSNMFKAGVIDEKKYNEILKDSENLECIIYGNDSCNKNLQIDNDNLYFNNKKMGNVSYKKAEQYMAVYQKPHNAKKLKVMEFENLKLVNNLLKSKSSIYFNNNLINEEHVSNIVVCTKRPHRLAYCELVVATSLTLTVNEAWEKYGAFSDYDKKVFFTKFKDCHNIKIFVIQEKIIYDDPVLLEFFAIYSNSRLKDVIFLT